MDVILLWFKCKNPNCGFIECKTKKQKVKQWKYGYSIYSEPRQRYFMRYVQGERQFRDSGMITFFICKYGNICLYDEFDRHMINSYINAIEDREECNVCINRENNERLLQI